MVKMELPQPNVNVRDTSRPTRRRSRIRHSPPIQPPIRISHTVDQIKVVSRGFRVKLSSLRMRWGEGVIIEYVWPDSPAEIAGLTIGDIIIAVDGEVTETAAEISTRMRAGPMVYVNLIIERDSESLDFKIRRIAYTKLFGTPGK